VIYILAGTAEQAKTFARKNNLKDWRYISQEHALVGARGLNYVRVGTFYNRADFARLDEMLSVRDMVDVTSQFVSSTLADKEGE
jgi:hypothetical protein